MKTQTNDYEITISFGPNHDMIYSVDDKTPAELVQIIKDIKKKHPEAKVEGAIVENMYE